MKRLRIVVAGALLAVLVAACGTSGTVTSGLSEHAKSSYIVGVVEDPAMAIYDISSIPDGELIRLGRLVCDPSDSAAAANKILSALSGQVKHLNGTLATPFEEETVGIVLNRQAQTWLC